MGRTKNFEGKVLLHTHHCVRVCVCNMAAVNNIINNNDNTRSNNGNRRNNSGSGALSKLSCSRCCGDLFAFLQRFRASPEEVEQRYKSREIDKFLEQDRRTYRRQVRKTLSDKRTCPLWFEMGQFSQFLV